MGTRDLREVQLASALEADPARDAFIARARARHGDRYDYGETRFTSTRAAIGFRCPRHGPVIQNAGKHLRHGCKRCGDERRGATQARVAGEGFEAQARERHGARYGYEEVSYRDARTPVTIRCPTHGAFSQAPRVHLGGSGCPSCGAGAMAAKRNAKAAAEYVAKAIARHGDTYGYAETAFVSARTEVSVLCRIHGPFRIGSYEHLAGGGCQRCAIEVSAAKRRKGTGQFVADARRVHGRIYDYGLVDYRGRSKPVIVLCAIHGPFSQAPGHHLQGRGCPACGNLKQADAKRRSRGEFIEAARAVHEDRYGYEDADYTDSSSKVAIRCPEHGVFRQEASSHLKGNGCRECAFRRIAALRRKDTATFVREARAVHGEVYDYGLTEYRRNSDKVTVECRRHGPFELTPSNHLNGQGCSGCGLERIRKARTKTRERFVEDARRIHGDRYGYERVDYEHSHVDVTVVCRTHGPFDQTPGGHLQGHGCPRCNHFVSTPETEWLDSLGVPERSVPLETRLRVICVDGYDPATRTAYLFHGDFWHGNPEVFPSDRVHPVKRKTYGDLHRITLMEEELLREAGYGVVSIWERDYRLRAA